jgi:hypothetical protein
MGKIQNPYCPARCKTTGKCYGKAHFKGKRGGAVDCPGDCQIRREWEKENGKTAMVYR